MKITHRSNLCIRLFFFILFTLHIHTASAIQQIESKNNIVELNQISVDDLAKANFDDIEQQLGRKLKWKERVGLKILKRKIRRSQNQTEEEVKLKRTDTLAILSVIFGIVGLFVAGIILGLLAVIFGLIAFSRITKSPETTKGLGTAKAGVILGCLSIIGAVVVLAMLM